MIIPERLYGLGTKAPSGGLIELWTVPISSNGNTALFVLDSVIVPVDRVVVLNHYAASFAAGAAQTFVNARLYDVDPAGLIVGPIWGGSAATGGAVRDVAAHAYSPQGYVLGPGHRAQLAALFTFVAASNVVESVLQGWSIPRGTIQLTGTAG